MATELLNQEQSKMEHNPTMASIAGPSDIEQTREQSIEANWNAVAG